MTMQLGFSSRSPAPIERAPPTPWPWSCTMSTPALCSSRCAVRCWRIMRLSIAGLILATCEAEWLPLPTMMRSEGSPAALADWVPSAGS